MKFPGGDYLRRKWRELFPTDRELEEDHQARLAAIRAGTDPETKARRAAKEAEDYDFRRACADRLTPHFGRLVVVTNFKEVGLEANATRVRDAVLALPDFAVCARIGVSALLSSGRDPENHRQLRGTADALADSFGSSIGDRTFTSLPQLEGADTWLLSLARAAEDTARESDLSPDMVGCIAAVSALDLHDQGGVSGILVEGTAFRLTHATEDARLGWEAISLPDYQ